MGISQSTTKFLASKQQDEEEGGSHADYPNLQNQYKSCGDSPERFNKLLKFCASICKAWSGLVQKVCRHVFNLLSPRKRDEDLVIPIQNPAEPLLGNAFESVTDLRSINDEEAQWLSFGERNEIGDDDDDVVYVPQIIRSMIVKCEEIEEEFVPANFPSPDQSVEVNSTVEEEEEKVQMKSIGIVMDDDINRDAVAVSVSVADEVRCSYASVVNRRKPAEIVEERDVNPVKVKPRKDEEEEEEEEEKVRKIKHYSSRHRILLVGEGDFSFSACLAKAFGSATNIIATSLNSKEFLKKNYGSAMSNIEEVRSRGGKVMHGIDATEIAKHEVLRQMKFDRIVFNFPFAGFFSKLSPESQLRRHRRLVSLFMKNAKEMISENGEIHMAHKTNGVHADFNLEGIASSHGLRLIAAVKFKCGNYPGYNPKYGFGGDKNFNCYPSNTFKFALKLT